MVEERASDGEERPRHAHLPCSLGYGEGYWRSGCVSGPYRCVLVMSA